MVGRKQERIKIEILLKSKKSEFLAVTGRRRVGKTFLIDSLLQSHYCFQMTGIQNGNMNAQLVNFHTKLTERWRGNPFGIPTNWQQAFLQLKTYLKTLDRGEKRVLFIDELPWVATARSGFLQMLAHFWNDYLSKEKHFILAVCGSATSWISQKIINDKGGLHNRVSEVIHLLPFSISETNEFLKSKGIHFTDQVLTKIYMTLGGIPFYLENLRKGESFASAIERMCFATNGLLYSEYNNLYHALFNNANIHQDIVRILAKRGEGATHEQILKEMATSSSGTYQRAMDELLVSNFIAEVNPFGKKKRGTIFRLIDEYSIFYHRFMENNRKYTPGIWQQIAASQSYKIWAGYAFESFCHKHIIEIKKALGISGVFTQISSFRVPGTNKKNGFQIDLIIDRKDDAINLCEIKFYSGKFTIDKKYYENLIHKRQGFIETTNTKKQIFITLITNHGVVENKYANEIVEVELTLADLIQS